jgi:uncharacterized protein
MKKQIEIVIPPAELYNKEYQYIKAAEKTGVNIGEIKGLIPVKRSIDARGRKPFFRILADVYINENPVEEKIEFNYKNVKGGKRLIIVGFGPAGMFAALRGIELGLKPIILERGKDHQARRRDLRGIQQEHIVNPDSNYCFGEGGAGTYSDGKLYTRATKRGDTKKILKILVFHGAKEEILIDTHPHIGSNKLPNVVGSIRETILKCGGEVNFNSRVTDFIIENNIIKGVVVNDTQEFIGESVILATGHSARDIYYLLKKKEIKIEPKAFALGVRIEHPQPLIDEIQYHQKGREENLPAAAYSLACDVGGRGVYSFCMCPGGIIIPSATAPGEVVVNGMSLSKRDSPFANSGFVASINEGDWGGNENNYPFGGLKFQEEIEKLCFKLAGETQSAPAQRITDFVQGKMSATLPPTSYIPGLTSAQLDKELPPFIVSSIKEAIKIFNNKMRGYFSEEAQIVATESRTSSPVRIPREKDTYMHPDIKGLFPCSEGAGYAGGIVSAAIDGENCCNGAFEYISRK